MLTSPNVLVPPRIFNCPVMTERGPVKSFSPLSSSTPPALSAPAPPPPICRPPGPVIFELMVVVMPFFNAKKPPWTPSVMPILFSKIMFSVEPVEGVLASIVPPLKVK